jgi:hypothetical protein
MVVNGDICNLLDRLDLLLEKIARMNFDKLVESMIKDVQERGEFDDLPGN